jgi:hypothetical protein
MPLNQKVAPKTPKIDRDLMSRHHSEEYTINNVNILEV